ncbi:uncharacterized protein BXZ73DRAFT_95683 [Epithele typhae]|uniref:uncharacterized protein n=1 Tax=Epithele typhae TaxID=378194 RepID=UPI002008A144|nr:uncharacterized protein BXZ73DRAFT_95683 [Epithele typhae]KAH9946185.1 hypothetical protein BXZ73DRAFT_95683 [Epithele typhae]
MGREVAAAYRRRKYTLPTDPFAFPLSSPSNSSMDSLNESPDNLTPARKHHKLLKDGSEVWSKDVEKIFVDGLRQYWQSPWATYSRGRSRWRNQFLVDHLKKAGVERTKKQVAVISRSFATCGEANRFHLVAGGEELFQDNGLFSPTNRKSPASPTSSSSVGRGRANSIASTNASSPSSTPEFPLSDFPPEMSSVYPSLSPQSNLSSYADLRGDEHFACAISPSSMVDPAYGGLSPSAGALPASTPLSVKLEPLAMDSTLFTLPHAAYADHLGDYAPHNRIASLYFWADGMTPLAVDLDRLVGGANDVAPSTTFLHFRVSVPPVADLRCPPTFQGINGAVSLARSWQTLARCHSKSSDANGTIVLQDVGAFTPVTTPQLQTCLGVDVRGQQVCSFMPESALTRCHWIDTVSKITQQVFVDNEVLAVLVYHIDRTTDPGRPAPAMEVISVQKCPWRPQDSSPTAATSPYQLLTTSPPVSPTLPTFPRVSTSAGGPLSPQPPIMHHGIHSPGASSGAGVGLSSGMGGVGAVGGMDDASARMFNFAYSLPSPYGFHSA